MCRLCTEHGEGQKWFLRAANYADDLLADSRRRGYIGSFARSQRALIGRRDQFEMYAGLPAPLKPPVRRIIEARLERDHYGQIVTPAEARQIIGLVNSVFRLPCVCRRITLGGEHRYCLGFSMSPDSLGAAGVLDQSYWAGPDGAGLERLTKDQALSLLSDFEEQGLVHSVWTFGTPYIGGLCNCSLDGCRALIGTVDHGIGIAHPGESIGVVDGNCACCGSCLGVCPFGALGPGPAGVVRIDASACYGCGLCERICPAGAITLRARA